MLSTEIMPFSEVKVSAGFMAEEHLFVKADEKSALDGDLRQRDFDDDAEVVVLFEAT